MTQNKSPPAHTPSIDNGHGVCKVRRCFTLAANVDGLAMSTDGPGVCSAIELRSGNGASKSGTNTWNKSGDTHNAFGLRDATNTTHDDAVRENQLATPKHTDDALFGSFKVMLPAHNLSKYSNWPQASAGTAQ